MVRINKGASHLPYFLEYDIEAYVFMFFSEISTILIITAAMLKVFYFTDNHHKSMEVIISVDKLQELITKS